MKLSEQSTEIVELLMKNRPTENILVPRKGARTWRFMFENGELRILSRAEEDPDGSISFAMPHQEDFDEITKVLLEKVGCDACAEGSYSIRPGRPAKLSWRIVSPTH